MTEGIPALPLTPHLTDREHNDLLDGRVPRDDHPRLVEHLDACPRCRAIHDDLRSLLALARASRHTAVPPEELWSLVSACTVHERAVRRQLVRSARTPIAGMALVVATLSATAGVVAERGVLRSAIAGASTGQSDSPADGVAGRDDGASGEGASQAVRPAPVEAAPTEHFAQREKPMPEQTAHVEPLPTDPEALRARAAAIDVRIRNAVKSAATLSSDSTAYRELADLYAERRMIMETLRAMRR